MNRYAYAVVACMLVVAPGCESGGDKATEDATSTSSSSPSAESQKQEASPEPAPELVETVDRPDPRSVKGGSCDSPAKLTKLAANTVLTAEDGGCYLIDKTMEVRGETNKLTIEPGVTIKFAENAGLYIHKAALRAKGTSEKPIVLTGKRQQPGFWKGVGIRGSHHSDNALEHVEIRYAGNEQTFDNAQPAALMFDSSRGQTTFDVRQTKLVDSAAYGLYAENQLDGNFQNNELTGNKKGAAHMAPGSVTLLDDASTYTGNETEQIRVWGGQLNDGNHTWPATGVPYVVEKTVEVRNDGFLTLKPGVTVEFSENTGLYVHKAKLNAEGTNDAPITLTGRRKVKGFWRGVAMRGSDSVDNALRHVTISYAGSDNAFDNVDPAGLMLDESRGSNSLTIANTTLSNNAGFGLYVEDKTDIDFADNTLTSNVEGAARVHPSVVGMLDAASTYSGNESDRVVIWGAKLHGREATWPAIDVPYFAEGNVEIRDESMVTIEPGATLTFAENTGLYIHKARLKAAGTADKPITFTGARESAGYWRGIAMRGTSSIDNQFKHVAINYAGSSDNFDNVSPAALMLDQSRGAVKVTLEGLTVSGSGGAGLHIEQEVTITSPDCAGLAAEAKPRVTEGSQSLEEACKTG